MGRYMFVMSRKSLVSLFVIGAALSAFFTEEGYCAKGVNIGVVNLSKVFEEYERRVVLDKKLKDIERRYGNLINEKQDIIMLLKDEIELLDMGSKSRNSKEDELQKKGIELEVFAQFAEQNILKKYKEYFEAIYVDVSKEIRRYGEAEGFDIILKDEESEIRSDDITDLQFKIGIKNILYFSDKVDITSAIIKGVNDRFSSMEAKK